jgi:hypothetical protein
MVEVSWNGNFKKQHKIRVVFQIDEIEPESKKPYVVMERFTLSLHENSKLRPFLESWRGKRYTSKQADEGVDVENMVGVGALLQVVHREWEDKTYANIQSIMRDRGEPLEVREYVRVKDRKDEEEPPIGDPPEDDTDDDLPF